MPAPYKVQSSGLELPFKVRDHIAVAWKDTILIWGGRNDNDTRRPEVVRYREGQSGKWITKTTSGDYPPGQCSFSVTGHVLNDKLYVLGFDGCYIVGAAFIHTLDLNSWTWTAMSPTGNQPEGYGIGMSSWIHNGRIFCFGGYPRDGDQAQCNWLFCYNTTNNAWEWPDQECGIKALAFYIL